MPELQTPKRRFSVLRIIVFRQKPDHPLAVRLSPKPQFVRTRQPIIQRSIAASKISQTFCIRKTVRTETASHPSNMKTNNISKKILAIIIAAGGFIAAPGTSIANNTTRTSTAVSTETGFTSVALDAGLVAALGSLQVRLTGLSPSTISSQSRGTVSFPIVGGVFDAASTTGEILHRGGLVFSAGGTSVVLSNFIIEVPSGRTPVITGLATVNGALAGRIPLFSLDLSAANLNAQRPTLGLGNVKLTLTATAAGALNSSFNVNAFAAGAAVGTAHVGALTVLLPPGKR